MSDVVSSSSPAMWLELLPGEICTRIALHVSAGQQTRNLFNFAILNIKMLDAAVASLSHSIYMVNEPNNSILPAAPDWTSFFHPSVTNLHLGLFCDESEIVRWIHYFLLPNLVRVTICAYTPVLSAVSASQSIREISMGLQSDHDLEQMFRSLSRMRITRLQLVCGRLHEDDAEFFPCRFSDPTFFNAEQNNLAAACPYLESLSVFCSYFEYSGLHDGVLNFRFLKGLHPLQELKFNGNIPQPIPAEMTAIPTIRSCGHCCGMDALMLSHSIAELHVKEAVSRHDIRRFLTCSKMENLSMKLRPGVEEVLPEVIGALPSLHSLTLLWDTETGDGEDDEVMQDDDEIVERGPYITAVPGAVLRVVRAARRLKCLSLHDVRLPIKELISILQHFGPRLEEFGTSVYSQEESVVDRTELLLIAIARYNNNLQNLKVSDRSDMLAPLEVSQTQASRMWIAARQVVQRVPTLDESYVKLIVQRMTGQYSAM